MPDTNEPREDLQAAQQWAEEEAFFAEVHRMTQAVHREDTQQVNGDDDAMPLPLAELVAPDGQRCEWCGELIAPGHATSDLFLAGVFGYYYCSDDCRLTHIMSK